MKKSFKTAFTVLTLMLVLSLSLLIFKTVNARKTEAKIYSGYNKAFYELNENIEKINIALKKASLASDSHSLLSLGAVIREASAFAISSLGEIETESPLTNINTFLNQAGDYVKAIAITHSDGSRPTKKEQDTFLLLSGFSKLLKDELSALREKIASGEISYSRALADADETLGEHLSRIESEHFASYEPLSYNGGFSSHLENASSDYLSSLPEITEDTALKKALDYLGGNIPLILSGENSGDIPSYLFYCNTDTSKYSMKLSKNGGKLIYYTESRPLGDATVGTDEALLHAINFTSDSGYPDMKPVFYENTGGFLMVTLAPVVSDTIHYSDTIKVDIALDTASVIGFNAEEYLLNHKDRTFPEVSAVAYDHIANINEEFLLKSLKKCFIPSGYGNDLPCLEAMGSFKDETYLIYIHAETGMQEDILLLSTGDKEYFAS